MIPIIIIVGVISSLFGLMIDRYLIIKLFIGYEIILFQLFGVLILGCSDLLAFGIILLVLFFSSLELVIGLAVLLI
jgi:hypothetical protein